MALSEDEKREEYSLFRTDLGEEVASLSRDELRLGFSRREDDSAEPARPDEVRDLNSRKKEDEEKPEPESGGVVDRMERLLSDKVRRL